MRLALLTLALYVALLLCPACGGRDGAGSAGAATGPQEGAKLLYVENQSHLTTGEVQVGLAAVQRQLDEEFRRAWQVEATLVLADPPYSDSYRVLLVDIEPHYGSDNGGYHDGVRTSWVATPGGWTEILSHECIEMLLGNICDPVQRPYGEPPVENFLLPNGTGYLESKGE